MRREQEAQVRKRSGRRPADGAAKISSAAPPRLRPPAVSNRRSRYCEKVSARARARKRVCQSNKIQTSPPGSTCSAPPSRPCRAASNAEMKRPEDPTTKDREEVRTRRQAMREQDPRSAIA